MNSKTITPILIIEDNSGDAQLVRLYLKEASLKHELFHADTLFEGVEIIKDRKIELVLLDLTLPDTAGFKTLSSFLERVPNIPVIVLTGTNNEIIGNQAIKAGAQDFLVKGQFDGKLLGRAIRYAIQRYKTQLKLEETAKNLSLSEKRYVEAQQMARFGNWEMDIVSNEMKWTEQVFRIFDFIPGSITPSLSDYMNYVHIEDKAAVESFFEKVIKDGQQHTIEHRIVVDGRNIKYVAIQAKVYFEELNQRLSLVGGIQDITERKQAEQLIIEKNMSKRTSKIKEEALADMSFHIRTPLSSIVNLVYLIEKTRLTMAQQEFVDGVKTSVEDLSLMLTNLLNFSVLATENLQVETEDFRLNDFLQSAKKIVQLKADTASLNIDFDIEEAIPETILADSKKITQVLFNLIDSAIFYSDNGQTININSFVEAGKESKLWFIVNGNSRQLPIEKINQLSNSEKLLEVFQEENEPDKQELGIAICSKLCKLMEGSIKLSGNIEGDFSFKAEIPIELMANKGDRNTDAPDMPIRILLVEDHFLNQIATKKVLTTWSEYVTVDIAENGLIGVEKQREHEYDLILMDIQMPIMNGIEAASKIREKSSIPMIALTANATKQEKEKCMEVGIDDYLAKPFQPEELHAKIMNILVAVVS